MPRAFFPFSLKALTNFAGFELSVVRRAEVLYEPDEAGRLDALSRRRPTLNPGAMLRHLGFQRGAFVTASTRLADIQASLAQPPGPRETAIEIPARLILSPNQNAVFLTPGTTPDDVFSDDASPGSPRPQPLWSARLMTGETDPGLRAVHSPDLRPDFVWGRQNRPGLNVELAAPGAGAPPRGPIAPWFIDAGRTSARTGSPSEVVLPLLPGDPSLPSDDKEVCKTVLSRANSPATRLPLPLFVEDMCRRLLSQQQPVSAPKLRFRGPTDAYIRHELVLLTSAWGMPVVGRRSEAGQLAKDSSQVEPDREDQLVDVLPGSALYTPRTLDVSELKLTALGGSFRHDTAFEPPAAAKYYRDRLPLFDALSIERWQQWTVLGRDIYCEVVFKGFLFPFGHRASLVQVSERTFLSDRTGAIRAYLRQRMFIRAGKPERLYPGVGQPDGGRAFPAETVRILTVQTPDILDPNDEAGGANGRLATERGLVFWPRMFPMPEGNIRFEFLIDGCKSDLPLLFVDNVAANDADVLQGVVKLYNAIAAPEAAGPVDPAVHVRTVRLDGRKWRYAPEREAGSCSIETDHMTLAAEGQRRAKPSLDAKTGPGGPAVILFDNTDFDFGPVLQGADQPPFYPRVEVAAVRLRQTERLVGRALLPVLAQLDAAYVADGLPTKRDDASTPTNDTPPPLLPNEREIYLGFLAPGRVEMGPNGDQSGGVFRPEGVPGCASRTNGIVTRSEDPKIRPDSSAARSSVAEMFTLSGEKPAAGPGVPAKPDLATARAFFKTLFSEKNKILGVVSLQDIIGAIEPQTSDMPRLAETLRFGAGDAAASLDTVRTRVVVPLSQAVSAIRKDWDEIDAELVGRQKKAPLPDKVKPVSVADVFPDLSVGLDALKSALNHSAEIEDPIAFALSLGEVYAAGRRFLDAVKRAAANPVERFESTIAGRLQEVAALFPNLDADMGNALRALTAGLQDPAGLPAFIVPSSAEGTLVVPPEIEAALAGLEEKVRAAISLTSDQLRGIVRAYLEYVRTTASPLIDAFLVHADADELDGISEMLLEGVVRAQQALPGEADEARTRLESYAADLADSERRLERVADALETALGFALAVQETGVYPRDVLDAGERASLADLWAAKLVAKTAGPGPWGALSQNIAAALSGSDNEVRRTVRDAGSGAYGDAGQLLRPDGKMPVEAIVEVPHADLALALEAQRVEELCLSLKECCDEVGVRLAAEAGRQARPLKKNDSKKREHLSQSLNANRGRAADSYNAELDRQKDGKCATRPTPNWAGLVPAGASNAKEREDSLNGAFDAHEYATWPQYANGNANGDANGGSPSPADDLASHRFFAIQSNPSLSRAFGLAFDVEFDDFPGPSDAEAFFYISPRLGTDLATMCGLSQRRPRVWTLVKRSGAHFWPATEEEAHACALDTEPGFLDQVDGLLAMGAVADGVPRFDLTTLDVRTATEMEMQRRVARDANPGATNDDLAIGSTLKTAGIALVCRSAQVDAARAVARRKAKNEIDPAKGGVDGCAVLLGADERHLVLDAEDLTVGYRLLVGVPAADDRTEWRPLMARYVTFGAGAPEAGPLIERVLGKILGPAGSRARVELESAFLTVPSRLLPTQDGNEAVTEQCLAVWTGEPMGVDCGGGDDGPVRVADDLGIGQTLHLPENNRQGAAACLVPLLYGYPYRLAMAVVYSGGASIPIEALPDDTGDQAGHAVRLYYPPATLRTAARDGTMVKPFFRALRQHRIGAPVVLLPEGHALRTAMPGLGGPRFVRGDGACGPMGFEQGLTMIVRSVRTAEGETVDPRLACRATPTLAQRLILVPSLPLDEVACHGVYPAEGQGRRPTGALPTLQYSDGVEHFPVTRTTRVTGADSMYFTRRRTVVGSSSRSGMNEVIGDSVFARASTRQSSFYPDPAADCIALGLRRPGETSYLPGGPVCVPVFRGAYPGVLPLLLTLVQTERSGGAVPVRIEDVVGPGKGTPQRPYEGRRVTFDPGQLGDVTRGSGYTANEIRLSLAPGEAFDVDLWCVPSAVRLAREFNLIQALGITLAQKASPGQRCSLDAVLAGASLCLPAEATADLARASTGSLPGVACIGPGGVAAPSNATLLALAHAVRERMLRRPVPEISAVATVRSVHACDRAGAAPSLPEPAGGEAEPFPAAATFDPAAEATTLRALRPLAQTPPDPAASIEVAAPGSTRLVMAGEVEVDLNANDTIEIIGRMVLPGSSIFDDPKRGRSLAARRAGNWPKRVADAGEPKAEAPHLSAAQIFGFAVRQDGFVLHDESEVTLLRVENLPYGSTKARVSLRACFEADFSSPTLRGARVTYRHQFADGKARRMTVRVNALSRTAEQMRTTDRLATGSDPWFAGRGLIFRPGELVPGETLAADVMTNDSASVLVPLPATVRPAKCQAEAPFPVFDWSNGSFRTPTGTMAVWKTRKSLTRIPLARPWFSSGQDEKVGIILWPPLFEPGASARPNLVPIPSAYPDGSARMVDVTGFSDDDLGDGGAYVTRRGGDPLKSGPDATAVEKRVFMHRGDFPDALRAPEDRRRAEYVPLAEIPLSDDVAGNAAAPRMLAGLLLFEPRFDPETEMWYIDVETTRSRAPDAFVRFGLVRYQPNAPRGSRCSRPVVQWAQPLPDRRVRASRTPSGSLRVEMRGHAFFGRASSADVGAPAREKMSAPRMKVTLFEELGGNRRQVLTITKEGSGTLLVGAEHRNDDDLGCHWRAEIYQSQIPQNSGALKVLVEEIEVFRPASYAVEPLDIEEALWRSEIVEGGPRFAAILSLDAFAR